MSQLVSTSFYTIAPFTGPAAPFVALGGFIASGFGLIPPRGNFQKFERVALPTLSSYANSTGYPVLVQWFNGDIVQVNPDGKFGVALNIQDNPSLAAEWKDLLRQETSFYHAYCTRKDDDCANNAKDYKFQFYEKAGVAEKAEDKVEEYISNIFGDIPKEIIYIAVGAILLLLFLNR